MIEHYYTENPKAKNKPRIIRTILRGEELTFETNSSVFSPKEIDKATRLLIEYAPVKEGQKILDLGCGYGAVGVSIAKTAKMEVTMSDVNGRALAMARINSRKNHVNTKIEKSDGFSRIKEKFDAILLNPPHSAGRETCTKLITESKEHLNEKGTLSVVAYHNKGGKYYELLLKRIFLHVETLCKKGGIRVYMGRGFDKEQRKNILVKDER
ncbi:class I SAM-dependent methyltransferase [Candidatus Woesearchaeota archaeon]|nr:class I SAM-dependent methyltransferase [Candidatus Woesearchaeota archaeon]